MSAQMTLQERLSFELMARAEGCAFNVELSAAGLRMARFDRCFLQARKKIRLGTDVDMLHAHELEALQDAASIDNTSTDALIAALKK